MMKKAGLAVRRPMSNDKDVVVPTITPPVANIPSVSIQQQCAMPSLMVRRPMSAINNDPTPVSFDISNSNCYMPSLTVRKPLSADADLPPPPPSTNNDVMYNITPPTAPTSHLTNNIIHNLTVRKPLSASLAPMQQSAASNLSVRKPLSAESERISVRKPLSANTNNFMPRLSVRKPLSAGSNSTPSSINNINHRNSNHTPTPFSVSNRYMPSLSVRKPLSAADTDQDDVMRLQSQRDVLYQNVQAQNQYDPLGGTPIIHSNYNNNNNPQNSFEVAQHAHPDFMVLGQDSTNDNNSSDLNQFLHLFRHGGSEEKNSSYQIFVPLDVEPDEVTKYTVPSVFDPHDSEVSSFEGAFMVMNESQQQSTTTSLYYNSLVTAESIEEEWAALKRLYNAKMIDAITLRERLSFLTSRSTELDNEDVTRSSGAMDSLTSNPSSQYTVEVLGLPTFKQNTYMGSHNMDSSDKIFIRKLAADSHRTVNKVSRSIRIFISSTFQDFQGERDYFTKFLFPKLIKDPIVTSRDVTITIIDLRWGITSEQSSSGDVISICLAEIDRCRPFFIGLIGSRYGWAQPMNYSSSNSGGTVDSLLKQTFNKGKNEYPWIERFEDRSITELEVRHAVLNDPSSFIRDHSTFYFRDEGNKAVSEAQTDERLVKLKNEIKLVMGESEVKHYDSLDILGEFIRKDLLKMIERDYDPNPKPVSQMERDRFEHAAFAATRGKIYIGRQSYFDRITHYVSSKSSGSQTQDQLFNVPLVVIGESGGGKSALVCNWVVDYKENNMDKLVIEHYIGSTPKSTDLTTLLTRLMTEIAQFYVHQTSFPTLPNDLAGLIAKFTEYLSIAAQYGGAVIILDALNQLNPASFGKNATEVNIDWIPGFLPENVKIITSTIAPSQVMDQIRMKTKWTQLVVTKLSSSEINTFIYEYLQTHGKTLNEEQMKLISSNSMTSSPLFLKVLLDEVRIFGSYEKLNDKLKQYLSAKSIPALFDLVFERLENEMAEQKVSRSIVGEILGRIWVSRRGISEHEILAMLKNEMPPVAWIRLYTQLSDMLVDSGADAGSADGGSANAGGGFLNFFHDYMRQGVESRYLASDDKKLEFRLKLARYFADNGGVEQVPMTRKVEEVPYQFWMCKMTTGLTRIICDFTPDGYFLHLATDKSSGARYDLYKYWRDCISDDPNLPNTIVTLINSLNPNQADNNPVEDSSTAYNAKHSEEEEYERKKKREHCDVVLSEMGRFLEDVACYDTAQILYTQLLELDSNDSNTISSRRLSPDEQRVRITRLNSLGYLLRLKGEYAQSEKFYKESVALCSNFSDSNNTEQINKMKADTFNSLAILYRMSGKYELAKPLYLQAMSIRKKQYGEHGHVDIAQSYNSLGCLYQDMGQHSMSEEYFKQAISLRETLCGLSHPDVAMSLQNLGSLYMDQSKFDLARPIFERAGKIYQSVFGVDHPRYAVTINSLASLEAELSNYTEAEKLYNLSLSIKRKILGNMHPDLALSLNDMAVMYTRQDLFSRAEPLYTEALSIREHALGKHHPDYAQSLNNLGSLYQDMRRYTQALSCFEEALKINTEAFGEEHMDVASTYNNIAGVCQYLNQSDRSLELYTSALKIYGKLLGENHADVAVALNDMAVLYFRAGNWSEAEKKYKRAMAIYENVFGPIHPDVAQAAQNIGGVFAAQGKINEARTEYERALVIYQTVFGAAHHRTLAVTKILDSLPSDT